MLNNAIQYFLAWWEHFLSTTFKKLDKCIRYSLPLLMVSAGLLRVTLVKNVQNQVVTRYIVIRTLQNKLNGSE
jgi:hypothetical protein